MGYEKIIHGEYERIVKGTATATFKALSWRSLSMKKIRKTVSQDSRESGRGLKHIHPEYKYYTRIAPPLLTYSEPNFIMQHNQEFYQR
jgi:hypothetical protein